MAEKKMSLKAWINSQLKNKSLSLTQAKKDASKYKSISAAKKAGSLYYTNKEGKVMIAAFAEDLRIPPSRPKELEKKVTKKDEKITKTELKTPQWLKKKKMKEADKKSMDKYEHAFDTGQIKRVPAKPSIRIHVNTIENQRARKKWEKKYGGKYNKKVTSSRDRWTKKK
jgi:hypothetical protein